MSYTLGIDLGTTNSAISIYRRGKPEVIPVEGQKIFPSVISFKDKDTMMSGHQAKKRLLIDPENSVSSFKRYMGDKTKSYQIYDRNYTPVDMASFILRRLVSEANKVLSIEEIKDVVITVPAYFNDAQRKDMKEAGKRAGLNVLRLLPEPTAAAIAYGLDKGKDQTIMVYDLGGGTFDITILKVERNNFKVIAVDGDPNLGGDDFDLEIMRYLAGELKKQTGKDILSEQTREAMLARQILKEISETAKIELSKSKKSEIDVPGIMGTSFEFELTREKHDYLIGHYIKLTGEKIKQVLKDAKMTADDIDRIILVGGSSRIVLVKEIITELIKEPYMADDIDTVVSGGASIYAASLMAPDKDLSPDIVVKNVTAHSFGINMKMSGTGELFFQPVIAKNTEYPCESAIWAYTIEPYQKEVSMNVYSGEKRDISKNACLGNLTIPISKPENDRVPVIVSFHLDDNGMIRFTSVEFSNVKHKEISLFVESGKNNEKVDVNRLNGFIKAGLVKSFSVNINTEGIKEIRTAAPVREEKESVKTGNKVRKLWEFNSGTPVYSSPCISNGFIYFKSYDKKLYCLDIKTGRKIWEFQSEIWDYKNTTFMLDCSPCIAEGFVYFGNNNKKFYCLDAKNGRKIWEYDTSYGYGNSSPYVSDGNVYFQNSSGLYCLEGKTGKKIWQFTSTVPDNFPSIPYVSDGFVYFGTEMGSRCCLDGKTGKKVWQITLPEYAGSRPCVSDGTVYCGSNWDRNFYCIDGKSGKKIWEFTSDEFVNIVVSPYVSKGKVYFAGENKLYCLDRKSGKKMWNFNMKNIVRASPCVTDGCVYTGSDKFYCIDGEKGVKIWEFDVPSVGRKGLNIYSSACVVDGFVYFGADKLYCLDTGKRGSSGGNSLSGQIYEK